MESPNESVGGGPPNAPVVSGKAMAIGIVVGTVVLGVFTYYGVPRLVIPYFQAKPGQASEFLDGIAAAVRAYRADHGAFPPTDELNRYRRRNKNLLKSRSYGIFTYHIPSLTTPTAYIDPTRSGDPYAMPDQSCPAAYYVFETEGRQFAVIYSPGPNLRYDIRPPSLKEKPSRQAALDYLYAHAYDPTNGTRTGGDYFLLVE